MQDPCEVIIGSRTIIGPNVRFYGNGASVDPNARKGSQSMLTSGAIVVGDNVFIGGDAIILPHRVIGRGAVIGAGSVITKVCRSVAVSIFPTLRHPTEAIPAHDRIFDIITERPGEHGRCGQSGA